MTRLIDADLLRKNMEFICMSIMAGTDPYNAPLTEIDNAPTVFFDWEKSDVYLDCVKRIRSLEKENEELRQFLKKLKSKEADDEVN